MSNFWAIYKRELRCYYTSPIAYVILAIFSLLAGYFFYSIFAYYNLMSLQAMRNPYMPEGMNLTQGVMRPLFHNMSVILLFLVPLVTMRLFSEEKKSGTIELLFTYPVRDGEAVMGKFAAALTVFLSMLVLTFLYPLLMAVISDPEPGPIFGGYLGLFLMGAAFLSLGMMTSSLTENQIVAGATGFGAALLVLLLGWASSFSEGVIGRLATHLSLLEHMENFGKGVVDTADIVYYLNFSALFLFLTMRSLESKRWRG